MGTQVTLPQTGTTPQFSAHIRCSQMAAYSNQLNSSSIYGCRCKTPQSPHLSSHFCSHLTYDSLDPSEPITQTASRSVQLFSHSLPQTRRSVPILYNGTSLSPLKIAASLWGDPDSHLINFSLDPPESTTQTASRSVQPFLHGWLVCQTD